MPRQTKQSLAEDLKKALQAIQALTAKVDQLQRQVSQRPPPIPPRPKKKAVVLPQLSAPPVCDLYNF